MHSSNILEQSALSLKESQPEALPIDEIDRAIRLIRQLLPIQNPLYSYVHNNILMAFEDQYFFNALEKAALLYRAHPYLSLKEYKLLNQNSSPLQIQEAIKQEENRLKLSQVTQHKKIQTLRNHAVWETQYSEHFTKMIHDLLIPLIANFLDQGLCQWDNPWRGAGFWTFFREYLNNSLILDDWKELLKKRINAYPDDPDLRSVIKNEFTSTTLQASNCEAYLLELCFDLKGWAGMINRLETQPELAPSRPSQFKLLDFIAVRILCENALNAHLLKKYNTEINFIRALAKPTTQSFSNYRIAHETFELTLRDEFVSNYKESLKKEEITSSPKHSPIHALFCIDDREEPLRRHLEKLDSRIKTYGVVGFFGLDIVYHPLEKSRPRNQCPPVVTPKHHVFETPKAQESALSFYLRRIKSVYNQLRLRSYHLSRSPISGALFSMIFGLLSFLTLTVRILFPLTTKRILRSFERQYNKHTQIQVDDESSSGYSIPEMANRVEMVLSFSGIRDFSSPLIFVLGHGSTNTNNPFRQAYGCGACSGHSGFPNSKLFCQMANRPSVRALLKAQGRFNIPDELLFIPGYHDTCSDEVSFDLSQVKLNETQNQLFLDLSKKITQAAQTNSLRRSQLFSDTQPPHTPQKAKRIIQLRSIDLAQPRPEYGHSRTSLCVIGRRQITQNIEFTRGAFLVTYDPDQDPNGTLLREIAGGSIPVCANISLDYYFSRIDNEGFGAGTKLPLNITSLLGIMRGSKSDLLIGLGRQMIEIHDPSRIMVVIEAPLKHVEQLLSANLKIRHLVNHRWVLLSRICPKTKQLFYYSESQGWVQL